MVIEEHHHGDKTTYWDENSTYLGYSRQRTLRTGETIVEFYDKNGRYLGYDQLAETGIFTKELFVKHYDSYGNKVGEGHFDKDEYGHPVVIHTDNDGELTGTTKTSRGSGNTGSTVISHSGSGTKTGTGGEFLLFLLLVAVGGLMFLSNKFIVGIRSGLPAFAEALYRYVIWAGPILITIVSMFVIFTRDGRYNKRVCVKCAIHSLFACVFLAGLLLVRLWFIDHEDVIVVLLFLSYWLVHLAYSGIMKAVINKMNPDSYSALSGIKLISALVTIWFILIVATVLITTHLIANINHNGFFAGFEQIFVCIIILVLSIFVGILSRAPLFKSF